MNNEPNFNAGFQHSNMPKRLRAISMQIVNDIEEQHVELHILTDRGDSLVVSCPKLAINVTHGGLRRSIENGPDPSP